MDIETKRLEKDGTQYKKKIKDDKIINEEKDNKGEENED